jgi:hypothetical protein
LKLEHIHKEKKYDEKYWDKYYSIMDSVLMDYFTLGIELGFEKRSDQFIYQHEFLAKLIYLFPNSTHREEYDYIKIDDYANFENWENWIIDLEEYISKYRMSHFGLKARYDLARLYDDLWILLYPDSLDHGWYKIIIGKKKEKDKISADKYRQKAIKFYKEIEENYYSIFYNSLIRNLNKTNLRSIINRIPERRKELESKKRNWSEFGTLMNRGWD